MGLLLVSFRCAGLWSSAFRRGSALGSSGGLVRHQLLTSRLASSLDRRSHDDPAALGTRHRAADQQQVAHGIDFYNAQILNGAIAHAHMSGHPLALEHTAWRL